VAVKAPVFHRSHRLLHDLRHFFHRYPAAIAGTHIEQFGAVTRAHQNGLAALAAFEFIVMRDRLHGYGNRNTEEDCCQQSERKAPDQQAAKPAALLFLFGRGRRRRTRRTEALPDGALCHV
jgi:hypothetical protein